MQKSRTSWRKNFYFFVVLTTFCLTLVFGFQPKPVFACSGLTKSPDWKPPTIQQRVDVATIVLEGTVKQIAKGTKPTGSFLGTDVAIATIEVHQYLKGKGPTTIKAIGFGVSTMCLTPVDIGERAIFLTWGNPETMLEVGTYWEWGNNMPGDFIGYKVKEPVSLDLIFDILQASRQQPFVPGNASATPPPSQTAIITPTAIQNVQANAATTLSAETASPKQVAKAESTNNDNIWIIIVAVSGVTIIVLTGLFGWRKKLNR